MNRSDGVTAKKNANANANPMTDAAEKEKLFAFGIVAAILVIVAVLSMFITPGHSSNFCGSQFTSQQKYTCLESLAVSSDNSTACASLSGSYKDNCYAQIAAKERGGSVIKNLEKYNLAPQSDAPFYTVHDFSSPINGNDFVRIIEALCKFCL